MSMHCQCPRCSEPVTLPDGYAGDATVRCPLCDAEYTLDEAMQTAPPALIIVNPGSTVPLEAAPVLPGGVMPVMTEADAAGLDELPAGDAWAPEGSGDLGVIAGDSDAPTVGAGIPGESGEETGFGGITSSVGSSVSTTPTGTPSRRKKKKSNPLGQIIQVVFGAVMAVVIVYYILNAMGRKEWDYKIYLPFVKHTHTSKHFGYSWFFSEDAYTPEEEEGDDTAPPPLPSDYDPNRDVTDGSLDGSTDQPGDSDPTSLDDGDLSVPDDFDLSPPDELDPSEFNDDGGDGDDFDLSADDLGIDEPAPAATDTAAINYAGPQTFTPAQVGTALKAVQEGYGCPNCQSRGFVTTPGGEENCPKCEGMPNLKVDKKVLELFKDLSVALAFAEGNVRDRQIATEKKFTLLSEQGAMELIGKSAAFQLFNEDGQSEGGILFQAEVQKAENKGDQQILTVLIEGFRNGTPAVVVTAPGVKSSVSEGDTIGVLGYSVQDPKSKLSNYEGDEDMIVWAGCIALLY